MRENLNIGLRAPRKVEGQKQRLIFVAPKQAIFQCLCNGLQEHFHEMEVLLADRIDDSAQADPSVGLVLLGAGARSIGVEVVEQCQGRFPDAAIAVVIDNDLPVIDPRLIEQRLIQGVLPTSMPLDVWFALMRLVIAGGEYLPHTKDASPAPYQSHHQVPERHLGSEVRRSWVAPRQRQPADMSLLPAEGLETLTAREREILTLVSEGYQNKLIADRMALSEHTVKTHVHNLIAKLRVTNRTQAAAFLHEHRTDKETFDPPQLDRHRTTGLG